MPPRKLEQKLEAGGAADGVRAERAGAKSRGAQRWRIAVSWLCARGVRGPINHDRLRAMRPAMRRGRDEDLRPQHCFCIQVTYAPAMRPAQAEPAAILAQPHGY